MKTLQEEWGCYRDACYPTGTTAIQNQECHQAFFAGASVVLAFMDDMGKLPTKEAVAGLERLCNEAAAVLAARANVLRNGRINTQMKN
jgi:hypothetical protein